MNLDEFVAYIDDKLPPAPVSEIVALEHEIGIELPADYREFLMRCNGGVVGGRLWFQGPTPSGEHADAGVHHVGGMREESYYSLAERRACYQGLETRIPLDLLWIMDDSFGNAICIGVHGERRGRVYFWDHELEPDPSAWDGRVETAGNIQLLALSFLDFVAGLQATPEN
jgi:SMI1 / KNR4 family (SUKH-1)